MANGERLQPSLENKETIKAAIGTVVINNKGEVIEGTPENRAKINPEEVEMVTSVITTELGQEVVLQCFTPIKADEWLRETQTFFNDPSQIKDPRIKDFNYSVGKQTTSPVQLSLSSLLATASSGDLTDITISSPYGRLSWAKGSEGKNVVSYGNIYQPQNKDAITKFFKAAARGLKGITDSSLNKVFNFVDKQRSSFSTQAKAA